MGIFSRRRKPAPEPLPAVHDDEYGVYLRDPDGTPTLIMVNLSVHPDAPVHALPYFFALHVPYEVLKDGGLPTAEQVDELQRIEGLVLEVAAQTVPHRHAMSVTHDGARTIALYVPSQDSLSTFSSVLIERLGEDAQDLGFTEYEDPRWESYLDDVYPTPQERAQMRT